MTRLSTCFASRVEAAVATVATISRMANSHHVLVATLTKRRNYEKPIRPTLALFVMTTLGGKPVGERTKKGLQDSKAKLQPILAPLPSGAHTLAP